MMPRKLHWIDDEIYRIDRVKQIRPACASKTGGFDDRYTIIVDGQEKYIYFEHNPEYGARRIGRWYVEVPAHEEYEQWEYSD